VNRPPDWLDRILSYDDLSPEERREADILLREDAEARALLERVRTAESSPGPRGELPPLGEETVLGREEEEAASLRRLEERLRFRALGRRVAPSRSPRRIRTLIHYLVPAAAAAVMVLMLRSDERTTPPALSGLEARRTGTLRGDGGDPAPLRTGDAFVLHCELERPSFVVLVHVDPAGALSILDPEAGVGPLRRHAPGSVTFPPEGEEWFLEGRAGTETFLVASRDVDRADPAAGPWVRELGDLGATATREERVAGAVRVLETHFDAVLRRDLAHAP